MRIKIQKTARVLFLFAVVAVLMSATASVLCARAPGLYWIGGTTFISCGSSAGNHIYHCQGSVCTESTGELNQLIADSYCEQDGGEEGGGGGGHGTIQP